MVGRWRLEEAAREAYGDGRRLVGLSERAVVQRMRGREGTKGLHRCEERLGGSTGSVSGLLLAGPQWQLRGWQDGPFRAGLYPTVGDIACTSHTL